MPPPLSPPSMRLRRARTFPPHILYSPYHHIVSTPISSTPMYKSNTLCKEPPRRLHYVCECAPTAWLSLLGQRIYLPAGYIYYKNAPARLAQRKHERNPPRWIEDTAREALKGNGISNYDCDWETIYGERQYLRPRDKNDYIPPRAVLF